MPLVKQELPTRLEHPSSSPVSSGVCVAQFVVFCVVFCRSLFVHLSFIIWPLYCLCFYDYHFGTSNFQKVLASYDLYTAVIYVAIHNVLLVSSDHSIVTISASIISMKLLENVNGLNLNDCQYRKFQCSKYAHRHMFNFWSYLIDSFLKLEKSVNFLSISGNNQTQTNALGMKHYACSKNLIESCFFFFNYQ